MGNFFHVFQALETKQCRKNFAEKIVKVLTEKSCKKPPKFFRIGKFSLQIRRTFFANSNFFYLVMWHEGSTTSDVAQRQYW